MIRHTRTLATVIVAAVAISACGETAAPEPLRVQSASRASFPRSGALVLTKDCSAYAGGAGDSCTITSASLREIEAGSRVIYASAAVGASLDTDVVLELPGPGGNAAFGHCTLDLATGLGTCRFSGGTGKLTWFHATVAVSHLGGVAFGWSGTYSFSPRH